jgi:hypothetical protein
MQPYLRQTRIVTEVKPALAASAIPQPAAMLRKAGIADA